MCRQIERFYHLTYIVVSLIFLSPFVGYTASALMNNYLHGAVGQRGVAMISSTCHIIAFVMVSPQPSLCRKLEATETPSR